MYNLKNKSILVTGGTGSFGKNFIRCLIKDPDIKRIVVFSRDELKQFQMQKEIRDERVKFFIGDVRDLQRLQRAFRGVDVVIHAAALKQVPAIEYNPFEAVQTNIIGTQNVINACIDQGVEKAILISTDKAVHPANLYGASKLCAEKLFVSGNFYSAIKCKFSVVRYGNVIGSRGSVVEALMAKKADEVVDITDERMTRFWLLLNQGIELVMRAISEAAGGEIFVPKVASMKLLDVFRAIAPNCPRRIVGIRPGEKLHEILLTKQEALHTVEYGNYYVILPQFLSERYSEYEEYAKYRENGKKMDEGFEYTSDNNSVWISENQFRDMIKNLYE